MRQVFWAKNTKRVSNSKALARSWTHHTTSRQRNEITVLTSDSKVLVTGAAGFIGSFLCKRLLEESDMVVIGFDNMSDYYDVGIKLDRLRRLAWAANGVADDADPNGFACERFEFIRGDMVDTTALEAVFKNYQPSVVVNLAAQAGVRYSLENPRAYIDSNLVGFFNILECCKRHAVQHLVYASSSSVYGGNDKVPFSEEDRVDSPASLYAATKKSNELMAHAYSKLFGTPSTGLRFFTVYGPMGRPDMAYFSFTDKLVRGEKIRIFNYGNCERDFTYIDDAVEGIIRVLERPPQQAIGADGLLVVPHRLYNIGNNSPENLMHFVDVLCCALIREDLLPSDFDIAKHEKLVAMQPGDVPVTYADTSALEHDFNFKPHTSLEDGLQEFARWYKEYYENEQEVDA